MKSLSCFVPYKIKLSMYLPYHLSISVLYLSARAVIMKYLKTGQLKHGQRVEVQDQGLSGLVSPKISLLGWHMSIHLLAMSSRGLFFVHAHMGVSSFKFSNLIGQHCIFRASFNLNYVLKSPISKYSHLGRQGSIVWILGELREVNTINIS